MVSKQMIHGNMGDHVTRVYMLAKYIISVHQSRKSIKSKMLQCILFYSKMQIFNIHIVNNIALNV